jgi:hypothetical protein
MAKDLLFRFRLTEAETKMLRMLAEREGMTRSAYVRKLVRDRYRRAASASQAQSPTRLGR